MSPIRVFLLDDSDAFLDAAESFLNADGSVEVVGRACSTAEALEQVAHTQPDVVLATLEISHPNGLIASVRLKSLKRTPCVIILSDHVEPPYRALAMSAQADAFVLKQDFCTKVLPMMRQFFRAHNANPPTD